MPDLKDTIRYQGTKIAIETESPIRKGVCQSCSKSVENYEIAITQMHHWRYAYSKKKVKLNPILALDNTNEFCFGCHGIGDLLMKLIRINDISRVKNVIKVMPEKEKTKLMNVLKELCN